MRVAVLNDLPVAGTQTGGTGSGTELSIGHFARVGHQRGHHVDVVTPQYCAPDVLSGYDLLITKNIHAFTKDQRDAVARSRFVAWPSDYQWTKQRLFWAFQERAHDTPEIRAWTEFFQASRLIVYLSPLQRECYEWVMPALQGHDAHLTPPIVDTSLFGPGAWVPDTAATINGGLPFKGLHNNLKWAYDHPEVRFTFIGAIRDNVQLPPNARFVGWQPPRALAPMMGKTDTYVELPDTPQPANQSALVGLLSCRRVVTNKLVGVATYPWWGDRDACRRALDAALPTLWARLEGLV